MRILLTGGTGYIGSHTAVEMIRAGYEVELLDNLANSKITVLDQVEKITGVRPKFYEVDLCDRAKTLAVFRAGKFDAVMHFAGLKAVAESVEQPLRYYENNIGSTLSLLEAMKETGVGRIIFSSSATVYGDQDPGETGFSETAQTGAGITNPYGWTKMMIEQILRDYAKAEKGTSVTLLRYFNPVGADTSGLIGEDPNGIPNNLMPVVMKVYRGEIPELTIFGDDYETRDGSCERDFIHVTDLANGHIKALENQRPGVAVYNLGTGKPTSVFEIVGAFEKVAGKKLSSKIGERRAGDLARLFANPSLAEKELGWKAERDVETAVRDTLRYLRNLK
ncbi:UDP-glucose 4-epimerase GalE [Candidatus Saccharibacteria bacterium]|nr:UDP-glucose 4-epimerase GalE [Candidatus Saccharibacteria bacterium]